MRPGETNTFTIFGGRVIGIREADQDGNPLTTADPNWTPLGAPASNQSGTNFTPPFPSYASGHATFGGAVFQTLSRFYGRDNITFTITSDELNGVTTDANGVVRPLEPRTFTSFSQAAEENGQSRIYLGIHWSFDKVSGINQGDAIGNYVFDHLLLPMHGPMKPGNNSNLAMTYLQTVVDCTLMQFRDSVHRQVVMMQTIMTPQTTTFKFSSLAPTRRIWVRSDSAITRRARRATRLSTICSQALRCKTAGASLEPIPNSRHIRRLSEELDLAVFYPLQQSFAQQRSRQSGRRQPASEASHDPAC